MFVSLNALLRNIVLFFTMLLLLISIPQRACSQDGPIFNPLIFPIIKEVRGKFKEWRAEHKYNPRKLVNAVKEGAKKLEETTALLPVGDQVGLFRIFFEEASKTLDIKDFCRLYFQYRGDEKSKFNRTEFSEKWASDEYYEQNCLKKKKEPSDQALAPCGEGERTIAETAKGNYTIELLGDGTTTDQTVVAVTNNDTGAFGATTVKTMCSSTRTHKPPPYRDVGFKEGLTYSVAAANPAHVAILKAADKLASEGKFSKLGLHNAKEQVAQNAIWTVEGEKTGKPEHQVTNDSIKSRILKQVDPEKVTPEVDQALTTRVDEILACVNLTIKESKPLIQDPPPKKPEDDTVTPPPPETGDDSCEPGEGPEQFCIPPYTAFEPCDDSYQCITTTENEDIALCNPGEGVPTGGTTTTDDGDKDDEPGEGVVTTPPEEPSIGEPPEKDIRYGILLTRDDDTWIPKNPSITRVTAQIYEKKVGGDWVPSSAEKVITFHFKEFSTEPGECMNAGEGTDPDLYFPAEMNSSLICSEDPAAKGMYFITARTKKPVFVSTAKIRSVDWGAYGVVTASADGCTSLMKFCLTNTPLVRDEAERKKKIDENRKFRALEKHEYSRVAEVPEAMVAIPKDDNKNQIADAYEYRNSEFPPAELDTDDNPVGNKVPGDGLSFYEEYRGFRVQSGDHIRTKWRDKDLFIHSELGSVGIGLFQKTSGITCHLITEEQYKSNESRVINFNHKHAHCVEQHGLWLANEDLGKNTAGHAQSGAWNLIANNVGPPRNVNKIAIHLFKHVPFKDAWNKYLENSLPKDHWGTKKMLDEWIPELEVTVVHELAHACGVRHHGQFSYWTMSLQKGDLYSGDMECFMHTDYPEDTRPYYDGVPIPDPKFQSVPGFKKRFCDSPKGTHINKDNKFAGDAMEGRGNCKGQFIVNDAGETKFN